MKTVFKENYSYDHMTPLVVIIPDNRATNMEEEKGQDDSIVFHSDYHSR